MDYTKVLYYADIVEVTSYERHPRPTRKRIGRPSEDDADVHELVSSGSSTSITEKPTKIRTEKDARRSVLDFRRLCIANFAAFGNPVWSSFTYGANQCDVDIARADWLAFTQRSRRTFGPKFRYIAVTEFQQRGAVHYHAFLWGISEALVAAERTTRLVAGLWGKGYVDLINTDGSGKLATYMSKYAGKNFIDSRLAGRRAYISSRNVVRPIVDRGAVLGMYFHNGDLPSLPDLSTGVILHESDFMTSFMGRANYKKYKLLQPYGQSNAQ